jgi:hypothetical protein
MRGLAMTDEGDKHEGETAGFAQKSGKGAKHDRLKLALRENLKRRKSQARGRDQQAPASSESGDLLPYDGGGGDDGSQK